jgi:hypothetical protein
MISLKNCEGRFANHFFRNIAFSYISKQYKINIEYALPEYFSKMGFYLFTLNNQQSNDKIINDTINITNTLTVILNDANFFDYIKDSYKDTTTNTTNNTTYKFKLAPHTYCQTRDFTLFLYDQYYINSSTSTEKQISIINANCHKSRYENNNDVCIHVRLGDVPQYNPGFAYYDNLLVSLNFTNGFICSDSPNHKIVIDLVTKYKLKLLIANEPDTIVFASTCKYLILSQGTFSWLIGFLGFFSEVYFPKIKKQWHGDIFVIPTWNEIDW